MGRSKGGGGGRPGRRNQSQSREQRELNRRNEATRSSQKRVRELRAMGVELADEERALERRFENDPRMTISDRQRAQEALVDKYASRLHDLSRQRANSFIPDQESTSALDREPRGAMRRYRGSSISGLRFSIRDHITDEIDQERRNDFAKIRLESRM